MNKFKLFLASSSTDVVTFLSIFLSSLNNTRASKKNLPPLPNTTPGHFKNLFWQIPNDEEKKNFLPIQPTQYNFDKAKITPQKKCCHLALNTLHDKRQITCTSLYTPVL